MCIRDRCAYRDTRAELIVAQMIVADGSKSRFYRRMALNPDVRVCGIALAPHAGLSAVAVVTVCDGFGPEPLGKPCTVEYDPRGGARAPPEFARALASVPAVAIHDKVHAALAGGSAVNLAYAPGSLVLTIIPPAGKKEALSLKW